MSQNTVTLVGNLTSDPEVRQTSSGVSVANFRIAHTPRQYDAANKAWKDGEPLYIDGSLWRDYGERFAAAASQGDSVIVVGRLKQSNWETDSGEKRSKIEIEVDEVGFSPRFADITVTRKKKGGDAAPKAAPAAAAEPANDDGF